MKRTIGILLLLAVQSGCSSFRHGPETCDRCNANRLRPVPGQAGTTWKENGQVPKEYAYAGGNAGLGSGLQTVARPNPLSATSTVESNSLPPISSTGSSNSGNSASTLLSKAPAALVTSGSSPLPMAKITKLADLEKPPELLPPVAGTETVDDSSKNEPPPVSPPAEPTKVDDLAKVSAKTELPVNDGKNDPVDSNNGTDSTVIKKNTSVDADLSTTDQSSSKSAGSPAVRMVNSKRITINFEVKDVGPSGVSSIELWSTQDGKVWTKRETMTKMKPPFVVEVAEEGLYGFTLLARNGIGLAKDAPQAGDLPQIWVEVDLTKPEVELRSIHANCMNKVQNVIINWKASDKNLGPRPITLSYSVKEEGPWHSIAANIPNNGRFVWAIPTNAPSRFLVRVEAIDMVGNVGLAQTPKPVLMDRAQPTVSVLTVEPAGK